MFFRVVTARYKEKEYRYLKLVENRRTVDGVKQRVVAALGRVEHLTAEEIDCLVDQLENIIFLPPSSAVPLQQLPASARRSWQLLGFLALQQAVRYGYGFYAGNMASRYWGWLVEEQRKELLTGLPVLYDCRYWVEGRWPLPESLLFPGSSWIHEAEVWLVVERLLPRLAHEAQERGISGERELYLAVSLSSSHGPVILRAGLVSEINHLLSIRPAKFILAGWEEELLAYMRGNVPQNKNYGGGVYKEESRTAQLGQEEKQHLSGQANLPVHNSIPAGEGNTATSLRVLRNKWLELAEAAVGLTLRGVPLVVSWWALAYTDYLVAEIDALLRYYRLRPRQHHQQPGVENELYARVERLEEELRRLRLLLFKHDGSEKDE